LAIAGLADIGQVPFLFRFNAFPEAHLDSLENPAYATEFRRAEGRVFILPTFRGARTLQEYQSAFGPGGSLPSDYSVSPQVSYFAPAGGFTFGGSAAERRQDEHAPFGTAEFGGVGGVLQAVQVGFGKGVEAEQKRHLPDIGKARDRQL